MAKSVTEIPAKEPEGKRKNGNEIRLTRVAAYCRVSTGYDDQKSSYENQVDYYQQYIEEHEGYVLVGIYGDEGKSGAKYTNRGGFLRLLEDCRSGKIDLVLTKSLSRFARNVCDCLKYVRELQSYGIPVVFENEGINTMDGQGEVFLTILSAVGQEESRNISENIKWIYRKKFEEGYVVVNAKRFLGFDKDEDGKLVINEEQAKIVRRIYSLFEDGYTVRMITARLNADGVAGIFGEPRWHESVIDQVLTNEKNKGDLLLQKTFTPDFLTKTSVKNRGELPQYYVKNDHEAIIPPDEWEAVQLERKRREFYKKEHHVPFIRYGIDPINPFAGKIICGHCGSAYKKREKQQYCCTKRRRTGSRGCQALDVKLDDVMTGFTIAWDELLQIRESLLPKWEKAIKDGNSLERLRAKQFMAETAEKKECSPELILKVLEKATLLNGVSIRYSFYDGTEITVPEDRIHEGGRK